MITADLIERQEATLGKPTRLAAVGINPQFARARVDRDAFERFLNFRLETMRKLYPDLDPRLMPALNTMLLHFFLVGAMCGREDQE